MSFRVLFSHDDFCDVHKILRGQEEELMWCLLGDSRGEEIGQQIAKAS
jgi:hypothetical protein